MLEPNRVSSPALNGCLGFSGTKRRRRGMTRFDAAWPDVFKPFLGTKGQADMLQHRTIGENEWRYDGPGGGTPVVFHLDLGSTSYSANSSN